MYMFRDKKVIMIATIVVLIIGLVSIGTFSLMMVNKDINKTLMIYYDPKGTQYKMSINSE